MPASLPPAPSQATLPGRGTFSHLLRTVLSLPFGCPYGEVAPETLGVPKSDLLACVSPSSHLPGKTRSWAFSKPQICAQRVQLAIWRRSFLHHRPTKRPSGFCLHVSTVMSSLPRQQP